MTRYEALQILAEMGDPKSDSYNVNKNGTMYRWSVRFASGTATLEMDMYDPQADEFENFVWVLNPKESDN